jgi:hypothetical protein
MIDHLPTMFFEFGPDRAEETLMELTLENDPRIDPEIRIRHIAARCAS